MMDDDNKKDSGVDGFHLCEDCVGAQLLKLHNKRSDMLHELHTNATLRRMATEGEDAGTAELNSAASLLTAELTAVLHDIVTLADDDVANEIVSTARDLEPLWRAMRQLNTLVRDGVDTERDEAAQDEGILPPRLVPGPGGIS